MVLSKLDEAYVVCYKLEELANIKHDLDCSPDNMEFEDSQHHDNRPAVFDPAHEVA